MLLQRSTPAVRDTVIHDAERINQTRSKLCNVVELLVGYGLILTANWTSNPVQQWFYWATLVWIGGSTATWIFRNRSIEFRMKGFWRSLWIVGAALMLAAPMVAIAARMHTLQQPYGTMDRSEAFVAYAVWAIAQQWLLQGYFLPRLVQITSREGWAAATVAGLFAVAHLPNIILAVMALFWGVAASFLFLRFRSIVTLGFAHAILGIAVAVSIPGPVLHNMRVGLAYLQYQAPAELRLSRGNYRVSDASWNGNRGQVQQLKPAQKLEMKKPLHTDEGTESTEVMTQ
jgi:hypothetical protein